MKLRFRSIAYPLMILLGLALGMLYCLSVYLRLAYWDELEYFDLRKHLFIPLVNYTTWGILSPLVLLTVRKFRISSGWSTIGKVLGISLLLSFLHEIISNLLFYVPAHLTDYYAFTSEVLDFIVMATPTAMITRVVEFWVLYGLFSAFDYYRMYRKQQVEYARLESQLSNAQLNALRMQLQPHFLFNTLNTVSALMEVDVKGAQQMVSRLGNLMRTLLDRRRPRFISLREEIDFIKDYLHIEQVRFQDRLSIRYELAPEALNLMVPALILQPLVENAIKHGFAPTSQAGTISISARAPSDRLLIEVSDDGAGSQTPQNDLEGIGLRNVRDRLELIYSGNYGMQIDTAPGKGFRVRLELPVQSGSYEPDQDLSGR
jgi:signal transduction histidine kinase